MTQPKKSHGQEGWLAPAEIACYSVRGGASPPSRLRVLALESFLTVCLYGVAPYFILHPQALLAGPLPDHASVPVSLCCSRACAAESARCQPDHMKSPAPHRNTPRLSSSGNSRHRDRETPACSARRATRCDSARRV